MQSLEALIARMISQATMAEWDIRLEAAAVSFAPARTIAEEVTAPQTQALEVMQYPAIDPQLSVVGLPLFFDGQRPQLRQPAPRLGAIAPDPAS